MNEHKTKEKSNDFLGKYYPSIKKSLHRKRILTLRELLKDAETKYKKEYNEEVE